jgi:hypothetical protein
MLRGLLAPGGLALIADELGDGRLERAIVEAVAPYRTSDGRYRLDNEWHFLVARA